MSRQVITPRPKPCATCPFRRDVPSGIWSASEYAKLAEYDKPTGQQPHGVFLCHQADGYTCSGWAHVHGNEHSLALRLAPKLNPGVDIQAVLDYQSPVPVFESGTEAQQHGLRDIEDPGEEAREAIAKVANTRTRQGKPVNYS